MVRQEFKEITELDGQIAKLQHENDQYKKLLFKVVEDMENAAAGTTDGETFKQLTISYNKLKDGLKCV